MIDIICRPPLPIPWAEGEKIPWNDPAFSQRMLREHLSQEHDAASRRATIIDEHVAWIHGSVLRAQPTRILDLGCGPGLYTSRLARLGHECVGIDFAPASIAYARQTTQAEQLRCTYFQGDVRVTDYGQGYGLVMFIFGEFNVFRPVEARSILEKAHLALAEGGYILLEAHRFAVVRAVGERPRTWYSAESGLFADTPHLCLTENFWDAGQNVTTERYFIIDGATGAVTPHASSMQAYTEEGYRALLEECGFENIAFYPSLSGDADESQSDFHAILAQKRSAA